MTTPSDIAFSKAVKAVQERKGSRAGYAKHEQRGGMARDITADLAAFIAQRDSFYLATASADGQPYIQHRGGPPGFLRVLDERTLAFADFRGNRQYISLGNIGENDKVYLFLMDYAGRSRIKIWGRARVVEDDPALMQSLFPAGYKANVEHAFLITVEAWDSNCPSHIPRKFDAADVAAAIEARETRIRELEAEAARLSALLAASKRP